jgi:hypothetical protein
MKKILIFLFIISFGAFAKLNAQCTISRVAVEIVSFNSSTCQVVFNLSWQQEINNGNKFAYIHLWTAANYHTPAANWTGMYAHPSDGPKAPDLVNSLGTISIFDNGTATPVIGTTYPADPTVTPLTGGLTVVKTQLSGTSERVTIKNISVTLPGGCTGALPIKADVWASQAANGKPVHCESQGLSFDLKNPTLSGIKVCNPRSVSFSITNAGSSSITVHYVLYTDNGDAIFNPDGVGFDSLLTTGTDVTLAPGASLTQVQLAYPGANGVNAEKSIWLEAVVTGETATTVKLLVDPGCATLPVTFRSFAAKRNHSSVELKWVSATEINNSGFEVQRQIGTGSWQTIAFVPTQAVGGNSSTDLAYAYNDPNLTKGISNYRVRQVDFDGKYKYSEVRSVRGETQLSKTIIYPNPSFDGKINVVFDDQNTIRDVSLMDINGRIMKQWKGISNNNLQIDNLAPGLYNLRIVITSTGEQSVEKIVVNKR